MGKFMKKISAAFLAAAVCLSALAGCGSQKVDGTKTVMTVGDEKVPLGAAAFLARYQQAQIYQLYAMYLGQTANIFGQELEEGKTYADDVKEDVIDNLTEMVLLRQHMGDYKVELTDEEKQAILDVGQAYEEKNTQEVRDKIGAKREHVTLVAELQMVKAKMMEAMAGDIDENVTEEESGQSSVTYVTIEKEKAAETASSGTSSTESTASADSSVEEKNAEKKAKALTLIEKLTSAEDPAAADMDALAKEVDSSWSASKGTFTTKKTDDTELPDEVVEAAKDLKDGEVAKKVAESDSAYYVVRMEKVNDKDETEKKKEEILTERKEKNFDEKVDAWKEATKVTVDENVWKEIVLSDKVPFDFATESKTDSSATESAESTASSKTDSSVTESAESTASSKTDSSVTESAESAASTKTDSSATESAESTASSKTDSSVTESADSSAPAADSSKAE